jgi:hypothetical protein
MVENLLDSNLGALRSKNFASRQMEPARLAQSAMRALKKKREVEFLIGPDIKAD